MNVSSLITLGLIAVPAPDEVAAESLDDLDKEFFKELGKRVR
jgi:hypothetical protein